MNVCDAIYTYTYLKKLKQRAKTYNITILDGLVISTLLVCFFIFFHISRWKSILLYYHPFYFQRIICVIYESSVQLNQFVNFCVLFLSFHNITSDTLFMINNYHGNIGILSQNFKKSVFQIRITAFLEIYFHSFEYMNGFSLKVGKCI